jgi:Skp family chaperone for outer membrane proteins
MNRTRVFILCFSLLAAAAAFAQPRKDAPASGFDADACAKHCKEMASAKQKMMDEHKAMMDKHDAAWKEIHAKLDEARKSRGDKKVAALESAIEQLLDFHESMMSTMAGGPGHPMGGTHGKMGGMMDCCAGHMPMDMGMGMDCGMMNKD